MSFGKKLVTHSVGDHKNVKMHVFDGKNLNFHFLNSLFSGIAQPSRWFSTGLFQGLRTSVRCLRALKSPVVERQVLLRSSRQRTQQEELEEHWTPANQQRSKITSLVSTSSIQFIMRESFCNHLHYRENFLCTKTAAVTLVHVFWRIWSWFNFITKKKCKFG